MSGSDTFNIIVAAALVGLLTGLLVGGSVAQGYWKDKSIKAGVAEYALINPTTGETQFRYKEIK